MEQARTWKRRGLVDGPAVEEWRSDPCSAFNAGRRAAAPPHRRLALGAGRGTAALHLAANLFKEARDRGYTKMNLLDIGGGFPAPYDASVKPFRQLATLIDIFR